MKQIFHYSFYVQFLMGAISFLFSLKLINNKNIPDYMKGFYWYPTVGMLVAIPFFFQIGINATILNNLSLIFHFSFLSIFIIRVIANKKKERYLKLAFVIFVSLIIYLISIGDLTQPLNNIFAISSFGLTIFCIVYYYQIFNNIPKLNLFKEPSFWIITGVFFAMSFRIPLAAFIDYLYIKIPKSFYLIFVNIFFFCTTIMHLFFIKAFICAAQIRKV